MKQCFHLAFIEALLCKRLVLRALYLISLNLHNLMISHTIFPFSSEEAAI